MSILPKFSFKNASSGLSKMLLRILNLESSLFPALKKELRLEEDSRFKILFHILENFIEVFLKEMFGKILIAKPILSVFSIVFW